MPNIQLPEPQIADIYSFGFNRGLLRGLPNEQTQDVAIDENVYPQYLSSGSLSNIFTVGAGGVFTAGFNPGRGSAEIAIFAGASPPDRGTAPFRVTMAGDVTATSVVIGGTSLTFQDIFGDGSDGAATIAANTTLTRDQYYTNLTINSGVTLNPGGYRIFVNGTLTNNGIIARNGNAGGDASGSTGGTGGTALADGNVRGTVAGSAGGNGGAGATSGTNAGNGGAGTAGTDVATGLGVAGVAGVVGGAGGSGATRPGGTGGTASVAGAVTSAAVNVPRNSVFALYLMDVAIAGTVTTHRSSAGSGGSNGGGGGGWTSNPVSGGQGGGGGGSGTPGGLVLIFAKTISNAGTISTNGGAGGAGGAGAAASGANAGGGGGGSGGSAGSGGVLVLVYSTYSGTGTRVANGGTGGAGGAGGAGAGSDTAGSAGSTGTAGLTGVVVNLQV